MNSEIFLGEAGAGGGGKATQPWILTARGFYTLWFAYVVVNALIRYFLSHTLMTDDVSESLLTQSFQLGYSARNPPLWEWLLWSIQQIVGPGFESHWLLRYGFIALLGVGIFRACRTVTGNVSWSAVVGLSSPLCYQIGWPFFEWGTHTLALIVVCLFTIDVALRYAATPTCRGAVFLGVLVGLGFLSKHGYAVFVIPLTLALLVERATRNGLLRRESLVVPLVAVLVVSPYLYWLVETHADLAAAMRGALVRHDAPHLDRSLYGLMKLVENSAEFLMPWALIAAIVIWLRRRTENRTIAQPDLGERVVRMTLLVSILITFVGVVAIGPTRFSSGYVVPVLVASLPFSAALLSRAAPRTEDARRMALLGLCTLLAITALRFVYLSNSGFPEATYRREMWPIADLADQMRAAGYDQGTLVAVSGRDGGNLRAALPDLRVVILGQDEQGRPPIGPDHRTACRLLWNATESIAPGLRWARTGETRKVETLPQVAGRERTSFDIPWAPTYLGSQRTSRWTIVELEPDDPHCR